MRLIGSSLPGYRHAAFDRPRFREIRPPAAAKSGSMPQATPHSPWHRDTEGPMSDDQFGPTAAPKARPPDHLASWTAEESRILGDSFRTIDDIPRLAALLGRSWGAIKARVDRLGQLDENRKPITPEPQSSRSGVTGPRPARSGDPPQRKPWHAQQETQMSDNKYYPAAVPRPRPPNHGRRWTAEEDRWLYDNRGPESTSHGPADRVRPRVHRRSRHGSPALRATGGRLRRDPRGTRLPGVTIAANLPQVPTSRPVDGKTQACAAAEALPDKPPSGWTRDRLAAPLRSTGACNA